MASPLTFDALFDADFLSRLQQFSLRLAEAQKGGRLAEQKTRARGQGLEFADFKPYAAGDDLRAIDWHVYQRMGRLFVRVFEEKQDLPVYFLVDQSPSMYLETPPRALSGLRAVLALAAIALGQHDSVGLFPFAAELQTRVKALSGKSNLMRFATMLAELSPTGHSALTGSLRQFAGYPLRQGLVVVVSDFFDEAGVEAVCDALQGLRHRVLLVQLVREQDADPRLDARFNGELRLEDCESGAVCDLTLTDPLIARYQKAYQAFDQRLQRFAQEYGAAHIKIDTDKDLLAQLSALFSAGGLRL